MALARTLRNDREKMGEHPMYRTSRGPGQLQSQSQQGAEQYRVRRGEDPLAELARLIGQEDPFAEFNQQPRRAPANGNGASRPVAAEPRYTNGNGGAYQNGNGHANGHAAHARGAHDVSRQSSSYSTERAPVRAPLPRVSDDRSQHPAGRPVRSASVQPQPQARTNGAAHAYQEQPRALQVRTNGRDPNSRYAERNLPPQDDYAEADVRQARQPAARDARAPRPDRYVPEEAPRHARARPQQTPAYREPQPRGYENEYEPEYSDDAYLQDQADDVYEVPRPRRSIGFWIVAAIVVASLIAVAFLGVFAYRTVFNSPPRAAVITKSTAPTKVEPQKNTQPTNAAAPNKTIQDRIAGAADQTQTLKREEQPVDLTTQQNQTPQFAPQTQQQAPQPQKNVPAFNPPPQQQQPAEQGPKKVKTMTVRSDGTVVQQNAPQPPQNNAPMQLNANPPAAEQDAPPAVQNRPNSQVPAQNRNVASLGPTPPPVQQQQQQQATTATGNYIVQVASHKTPEEAQAAWSQLKTQHASIFGTRNADIRKVDLGDRGTFYRAMVGPMNRDQANALCQNLKTAGAGCIVQTRN